MAGLLAADKECQEYPGNLYLVIRKEWVDLRDSTLHDWNNWIGRPINGEKNVTYENGSVLMFRHGADLNALKNINLGGCLMIQGEEMSEDDFWFLKGRLRRMEGTRQLRIECNYDGHNWIWRLFNKGKLQDGKPFAGGRLITTNTFDNEKNLPPDYIPGLMKLPKRLQERYLFGSDADIEGAVFDEFSFEKNVVAPFYVPTEWNKTVILDHGFTNPTAVLWSAVDWDSNIYIYDEHYEARKVISYHAEQIKLRDNSNVKRWLIDPSCRAKTQAKETLRSIIDEYNDYGLSFQPADNSQLAGINKANQAFKEGKLRIFKSCPNTIDEVSNWKWRKLKPTIQRNEPEEPEDKKNHTCDDIIYLMNSLPDMTAFKEEPINPDSAWGRMLLKRQEQEA